MNATESSNNYLDHYAVDSISGEHGPKTIAKCKANDGTQVTVICITYNQEDFIADAIESFIKQKTNFKYRIFIGDDCSQDKTPQIVREYAERYPDVITAFCREENMGALGKHNLIDLCERADSPYLAWCEGDDYWIDDHKLQKQFDYMEAHLDCRVCTAKTRIDAPEDWHLRTWYKETKDGDLIIPDSIPGYKEQSDYAPSYLIQRNVAHTSTYFFRWNYDLDIPDWYFEGMIGDMPMMLLQIGCSDLHVLPETTSVYRINRNSVFFDDERDLNFLHTRRDYICYLSNLRQYALDRYDNYPFVALDNRINLECANYISSCIKYDDINLIIKLMEDYPQSFKHALASFVSFYKDERSLSEQFGWDGYRLIARNKRFRKLNHFIVRCVLRIKPGLKFLRSFIVRHFQSLVSFVRYHRNSHRRINEGLWVFAGFRQKGYFDNASYFFEYIVDNHPEIKAYWITKNDDEYERLLAEGRPVIKSETNECKALVSHAEVAVIDHFRKSDFPNACGFNAHTKVVQLWHGVGFKALGDGERIKNTDVKGVRYSNDIIANASDSSSTRFAKRIKYWRFSYSRELFEEYFLLLCPGQEHVDMLAKPMHVPVGSCFFAGHPRNIDLYKQEPSRNDYRVLYAPTYRFNARKEEELVQGFLDYAYLIQHLMEQIDGHFELRLHPHTWRNYQPRILYHIQDYDRIDLNSDENIYSVLGVYDLLISDYSSIAMDFAMLDRPTLFYCPDYDWFIRNEAGFNIDFKEWIPGPFVTKWNEVCEAIVAYKCDPTKDSDLRKSKLEYFFKPDVNGPDNSERIFQEIQRRLKSD